MTKFIIFCYKIISTILFTSYSYIWNICSSSSHECKFMHSWFFPYTDERIRSEKHFLNRFHRFSSLFAMFISFHPLVKCIYHRKAHFQLGTTFFFHSDVCEIHSTMEKFFFIIFYPWKAHLDNGGEKLINFHKRKWGKI